MLIANVSSWVVRVRRGVSVAGGAARALKASIGAAIALRRHRGTAGLQQPGGAVPRRPTGRLTRPRPGSPGWWPSSPHLVCFTGYLSQTRLSTRSGSPPTARTRSRGRGRRVLQPDEFGQMLLWSRGAPADPADRADRRARAAGPQARRQPPASGRPKTRGRAAMRAARKADRAVVARPDQAYDILKEGTLAVVVALPSPSPGPAVLAQRPADHHRQLGQDSCPADSWDPPRTALTPAPA